MEPYGKGARNMLYSNVRIRQASFMGNGQILWLKVVYAQREYCDIIYSEVRHSQIGEGYAGIEIICAKEEPFSSLSLPSLIKSREALSREMGAGEQELMALEKDKCKVFIHYVKSGLPLVVLAKKFFVGREASAREEG
jgi:hypothetical protein